ncbi:MAG TPA: hypothetical protein ENI89_02645 [Desulfobulbus sp.]|nr:hypothetical protein [Desulfobulbus sp.]
MAKRHGRSAEPCVPAEADTPREEKGHYLNVPLQRKRRENEGTVSKKNRLDHGAVKPEKERRDEELPLNMHATCQQEKKHATINKHNKSGRLAVIPIPNPPEPARQKFNNFYEKRDLPD